jgi:hypothetical protein
LPPRKNASSFTILDMQKMAKGRGGRCLSGEYINSGTKLTWQCAEGHQWDATPNNVKRGSWCFACFSNALRGTIEEMQKMAADRGGKCLSEKYVSSHSTLTWQCGAGHQWEAAPGNVKHGTWCPVCTVNAKSGTIEEMQKIARSRGGRCLSRIYRGCETKLRFQCKEGHQWEAIPHNIKRRRWCPACAGKTKGASRPSGNDPSRKIK